MGERNTFEADFEFTLAILDSFFAQKRIRTALAKIAETEVSGWEKWWQIELALFLSEHEDVAEWNMEEPFFIDRRHRTPQDSLAIDLCFRRKGQSSEKFIFLELKQDQDWKRCIANMMMDADKVSSAQTKSLLGAKIRSFFLAGIYFRMPKADIHDYIEEEAEYRQVEWEIVESRFIADTPFSFTLL